MGVCPGLTLGALGALAAGRAIGRRVSGLLYGLEATDGISVAVAAFAMATVALIACLIPALRATRIDPLSAIRYE